jgi:hypothetical protein
MGKVARRIQGIADWLIIPALWKFGHGFQHERHEQRYNDDALDVKLLNLIFF